MYIYVCMHACIYVCKYVCIYIYIYIFAGFYVTNSGTGKKLVEQTRCCYTEDFCNYPNTAIKASPSLYTVLVVLLTTYMYVWRR